MDKQSAKDTIARYRHEAKRAREAAKRLRDEIARLRARPIGQREPLKVLTLQCEVNACVARAKRCEGDAKALRVFV